MSSLRSLTTPAQGLQSIPKADIHVHAETYARLDPALATSTNQEPTNWRDRTAEIMRTVEPGVARLEAWGVGLRFSSEAVEALDEDRTVFVKRIRAVLEEAARDGALYSEVLFGRSTVRREDFLDSFKAAVRDVQQQFPNFEASPIVAADCSPQWEQDLLPLCIENADLGLGGINIIPFPYDRPADWTGVYRWAEKAASAGLGITAHAGEFDALHLAEAIEVPGLTRIGHALAAANDESLIDRLARMEITVECPLTSNVVLGAVTSYEAHPFRKFSARGVSVTLCTDDPVRAATTIGREYEMAAGLGCGHSELRSFTENAVRAAFCTDAVRARLLQQLG